MKKFTAFIMILLVIFGFNYSHNGNIELVFAADTSLSATSDVEPVVAYPGMAAILKSGDIVKLKTSTPDAQIYYIMYPLGERPQYPFAWDGYKWTPDSEVEIKINKSVVIECFAEIGTKNGQTDLSIAKRSDIAIFTYTVQEDAPAATGIVSSHSSGTLSPGTLITLTAKNPESRICYSVYPPGKKYEYFVWEISDNNSVSIPIKETSTVEAYVVTQEENGFFFDYTVSAVTPQKSRLFRMGEDNFQFANAADSFSYPQGYAISIERFEELWNKKSGLWNSYYWEIYNLYSGWAGSCFGFSSASLKFNSGSLSESNFQPGAMTVYSFNKPRSKDAKVTRLLELCQISQFIPKIQNELSDNFDQYQKLVNEIQAANGEGLLLSFWFSKGNQVGGHAVVVYDSINHQNGTYSLLVYDNNFPDEKNLSIEINVKNKTYAFKGTVYSGSAAYTYGIPQNLSFVRMSVLNDAIANVSSINAAFVGTGNITYIAVPSVNAVIKNTNGQIVNNIYGTTAFTPMNASIECQVNQPIIWALPEGTYTVELPNYTDDVAYQTVTFFSTNHSTSIKICGKNIVLMGSSSNRGQIDVISGTVNVNEGKTLTIVTSR